MLPLFSLSGSEQQGPQCLGAMSARDGWCLGLAPSTEIGVSPIGCIRHSCLGSNLFPLLFYFWTCVRITLRLLIYEVASLRIHIDRIAVALGTAWR